MRYGSSAIVAAVLLVAVALAVRTRPDGVIEPIPGNPVTGVVPTLAVTAALLVAIIATTAGAVSLAKNPRTTGPLPRAPQFERLRFRLNLSYLWLAIFALVIALFLFPLARRNLVDDASGGPRPPGGETGTQAPEPRDAPVAVPDDAGTSTLAWVSLVIVAALSVAILFATWRTVRRQRRTPQQDAVEIPPPESEPFRQATELALHAVEEPDRQPREAIIACFATMEKALDDTEFAPLDSDTAKEVIDRAVAYGLMPTAPANTLRILFTEARFSPHEMTPRHRDTARSALHDALENLRR